MARISILNEAARLKEGKFLSFEVIREEEITSEIVKTEAWCPIIFTQPRRNSEFFQEAHVIGFDVDEKLSLTAACSLFENYKHIIGTTTNHQKVKGGKPACDRYRIVLFLSEPILTPADYKYTLSEIARSLEIPVDTQAKDAARWFIPCKEIVSCNKKGKLVPPIKAPEKQKKQIEINQAEKGKLTKATRDFLAQEPSNDGWHMRFIKAAMNLKEQNFTEEEAANRLRAASPIYELDAIDIQQLADVYANRGGFMEFQQAWPETVFIKDQIKPVSTSILNQRHLLNNVLGFEFSANSRREVVYYTERARGSQKQLLTDVVLARLNTGARANEIAAGESLRDLIITVAQENAFDPILDPLNELSWDSKDHISALFDTITLPKSTTKDARAWYKLYLRRWIIGMVTKIYQPGSENNVLVFQGEQAAGKSRWLKRLSELWPEGWGEGSISPDDKDHELRHLDNFIWHVAEFDSTTSRREVGALKDYFTKDTVNVRRPYSRLPIIGRSICSFCASVNSFEFLHDITGNRRYLVIPVIDLDAKHDVNISQVFAQAKAAMQTGERQWFSRDEILTVNKLNEQFLSKEEYLEVLEANAIPGEDLLSMAAIMEAIGHSNIQLTRPIRSNIRSALEKKKVQMSSQGSTTRFFVNAKSLKNNKENVLTILNKKKELSS